MGADGIQCCFCGEAMKAEMLGEIEIDRCPGCDALWFDAGELARHAARVSRRPRALRIEDGEGPRRRCPHCLANTLRPRDASGVKVLCCESCIGMAVEIESMPELTTPEMQSDESSLALDIAYVATHAAEPAFYLIGGLVELYDKLSD